MAIFRQSFVAHVGACRLHATCSTSLGSLLLRSGPAKQCPPPSLLTFAGPLSTTHETVHQTKPTLKQAIARIEAFERYQDFRHSREICRKRRKSQTPRVMGPFA